MDEPMGSRGRKSGTGPMGPEAKLDALPSYEAGFEYRGGGDLVSSQDVFKKPFQAVYGMPAESSKLWKNGTVDLDQVHPMQDYIPREGLRSYMKNMPVSRDGTAYKPNIVQVDGKLYAGSGTTRLGARMLRGEKTADVRIVGYDPKSRKFFKVD